MVLLWRSSGGESPSAPAAAGPAGQEDRPGCVSPAHVGVSNVGILLS